MQRAGVQFSLHTCFLSFSNVDIDLYLLFVALNDP